MYDLASTLSDTETTVKKLEEDEYYKLMKESVLYLSYREEEDSFSLRAAAHLHVHQLAKKPTAVTKYAWALSKGCRTPRASKIG